MQPRLVLRVDLPVYSVNVSPRTDSELFERVICAFGAIAEDLPVCTSCGHFKPTRHAIVRTHISDRAHAVTSSASNSPTASHSSLDSRRFILIVVTADLAAPDTASGLVFSKFGRTQFDTSQGNSEALPRPWCSENTTRANTLVGPITAQFEPIFASFHLDQSKKARTLDSHN